MSFGSKIVFYGGCKPKLKVILKSQEPPNFGIYQMNKFILTNYLELFFTNPSMEYNNDNVDDV
jgi:hypothetical protein